MQLTELLQSLTRQPDRGIHVTGPVPLVQPPHHLLVLPGAFNPLHQGHLAMAQVAERRCGRPAHFELSLTNVDKADLDEHNIRQRLAQFPAASNVWMTRAATFDEKSVVFPFATFVVGSDTIQRVADLKYYDNDPDTMHASLARLKARQIRFLVFGRCIDERFCSLNDLELPHSLREMCLEEISEAEFRADISSSDFRGRA